MAALLGSLRQIEHVMLNTISSGARSAKRRVLRSYFSVRHVGMIVTISGGDFGHSDSSYRGETCQHLDLDLVDLAVDPAIEGSFSTVARSTQVCIYWLWKYCSIAIYLGNELILIDIRKPFRSSASLVGLAGP